MRWFRRIVLVIGILIVFVLSIAAHYYYKGFLRYSRRPHIAILEAGETERLRGQAAIQRRFLDRHGFNDEFCFLVDMRLPSGKARFFVYDLLKDSILLTGMVAHGCGDRGFSIDPRFSNINGSNCTALGRYRIGYHYPGQFGLAYKLYGLDSTNDQAFNRNIVLHSYDAMPENETYPYPICNSRGCPMVSPGFLKSLRPLIDRSRKPVCLYIFD